MSDYDKIANLEEVIAKKDAEIAQLVSVINSECNKCGDCAKFGYDCNAGDIDGNENCRACKKFVSKDVAYLRSLVKDLADGLNHELEIGCVSCMAAHSSNKCPHAACDRNENRALVAKAKKAVNDD